MVRTLVGCGLACALVLPLATCARNEQSEEQTQQPVPVVKSEIAVCGKIDDRIAVELVPQQVGAYCVEPNRQTRAFGQQAAGTIDEFCGDHSRCETRLRYGLERVVMFRYRHNKGTPAPVEVTIFRFNSKENAYRLFAEHEIIKHQTLYTPVRHLGSLWSVQTDIAYVLRGQHLVELKYTGQVESPDQREALSRVLITIAEAIGERLPGARGLLSSAMYLPGWLSLKDRIDFEAGNLLGIAGVGPGTIGHYEAGPDRWQVFVSFAEDEAGAKEVFDTIARQPGAKVIKGLVFPILTLARRAQKGGPVGPWWVGRTWRIVYGVGDEPILPVGSAEKVTRPSLSPEEKLKRLLSLLRGEHFDRPRGRPR